MRVARMLPPFFTRNIAPMKKLILLLSLLMLTRTGVAQVISKYPFQDNNLPLEQRVDDLLRRLTLDERLQFMVHQNPAVERLGLKPYSWWNEALHGVARNGYATVYPMPIAMAATFNVPLIQQTFSEIGKEAHSKFFESQQREAFGDNTGLTFFAPNINIFRDPRWGRGMETFGEDPYLTAVMGAAAVRGLQGDDPQHLVAAACVKHLAVHSGPEGTRHEFDAKVTLRDLWTTYLPAFEYVIRHTNVQQVMCGYNRLNGVPCCTSQDLLVDILRNKWHYDNIMVTDCWALNDCWEPDTVIPRHRTHATAALTARDAFGTEVDLECGSGLPALRTALDSGYISVEKINQHVRRILRTRLLVGVDDPEVQSSVYDQVSNLSFQVAQQSNVLLKNSGVLPLKGEKIALFGPNAADSAVCVGNYNGTPRAVSTLHSALLAEHQHSLVGFDTACHLVDRNYKMSRRAFRKAAKSDVIVFVGGLSPALEGEELQVNMPGFYRGDRTQIELPRVQVEMIKELKRRTGKPIVLVLYTGSAIALEEVEPYVDAIIVSWYGGESVGRALAYNLYEPDAQWGRLPLTFYSSTSQLPSFDDYSMRGRTYRYLTQEPQYPFGYGLTYQENRITDLRVTPRQVSGNATKGTVVQVYLRNLDDPQAPQKNLIAFSRVAQDGPFLINLDPEQFRQYDENTHDLQNPKPGTRMQIMVGTSSADKDLQVFPITY